MLERAPKRVPAPIAARTTEHAPAPPAAKAMQGLASVPLDLDRIAFGTAGPDGRSKRRPNHIGLPPGLRAGVEALSGVSMDEVRVRHRSPEPALHGALAFARGLDIHLGPGQERHLPHEAWHVVQQARGRVRRRTGSEPDAVIGSAALEAEADAVSKRLVGGGADAMAAVTPERLSGIPPSVAITAPIQKQLEPDEAATRIQRSWRRFRKTNDPIRWDKPDDVVGKMLSNPGRNLGRFIRRYARRPEESSSMRSLSPERAAPTLKRFAEQTSAVEGSTVSYQDQLGEGSLKGKVYDERRGPQAVSEGGGGGFRVRQEPKKSGRVKVPPPKRGVDESKEAFNLRMKELFPKASPSPASAATGSSAPQSGGQSNSMLEYHPGGGIHSNYASVDDATGGSYFKVGGFRIGRHGSFASNRTFDHMPITARSGGHASASASAAPVSSSAVSSASAAPVHAVAAFSAHGAHTPSASALSGSRPEGRDLDEAVADASAKRPSSDLEKEEAED